MHVPFGQLALSVELRDDATLASFLAGDNQEIISALSQIQKPALESFLFLWGQSGIGKTHLLQGACHHATRKGQGAVYFPLKNLHYRADIFSG